MKLCECGCGESTAVARQTDKSRGVVRGQFKRFVNGHYFRWRNVNVPGLTGARNHNWIGGKIIASTGYAAVKVYDRESSYIYEHILIAEKALGRSLPPKAEVHHVNEIKTDNANRNLVICQDAAYHSLLHKRMRAFKATGKANALKCWFCQQWDNPENLLRVSTRPSVGFHSTCNTEYLRKMRDKRGYQPIQRPA